MKLTPAAKPYLVERFSKNMGAGLATTPPPSSSSSSVSSPPSLASTDVQPATSSSAAHFPLPESVEDDMSGKECLARERERKKTIKQKAVMELTFDILGYLATVISLAVYIPAVIDAYTEPDALKQMNPWMYWLALMANILWVVYASGKKAWPLLASSLAVVIMIILILVKMYTTDDGVTQPPLIT